MVEAYASDQRDEPVRRALAALAGR
jgi:hypothetical protein